ncbi:probable inactive receptor kinase At1g48480 [Coffea eugenioides]|uniref:probable inactive receptor kinase At1g48480 n=1 Tax=Coffea eugenioides TaxID=49369 RepID=UPI000F610E0A|nr:probable inactive receptor kinase At1g48480 [Coffea eugenioides]
MALSADISGVKLVFLGNVVGEYELEDLLHSDFSMLGKGTLGMSYKARLELEEEYTLAVKRVNVGRLSEMEFKEKIEELGKMDHENLLPIRAYCCIQEKRILVYDYIHMGSLAYLLHGNGDANKTPLNWDIRCRIAYGVARGIAYIHTQGSNICHGNLRSSNVFFNSSFDVRVSEFGLAQLVPVESKLILNEGYRAPEVTGNHEVSQKSDVYSFGVLLLELLTGKAPLRAVRELEGIDLVKWVRLMFQEKPILDVFDDDLVLNYESDEEQMVQLLQLAVCCTFQNPSKRPSMAAVANRIEEICRIK